MVEDGLAFGWVSLDEQDNDPVRLWRHILEALRQVAPSEDFATDVIGGMSAVGRELVEITLPMLINELAGLDQRVVLVLDDYHFITEDNSHDSVAFFLEQLPENIHLVLATRSDPQLTLGRLRARGEMNEIRTEQLAFSEGETATLLNEKMGLDIDPDDVSILREHTEGWPAGIYLASLSLQKREDKHAFIASFKGSNRYIVDLLGEEVLAGLPDDVREFLLTTSVLRSMTGSLCDAVTGSEDSGKVLRELARSNLFVVPLDEQGEWYRYHQLFSEFLLYELKSSRPELVPVLHRRASVWAEGAGFFEGAIRQALVAKDYEHASVLVARHWFEYVSAGQTATVEGWLEALPEDLVNSYGPLLLARAWISALYGRREERERFLALAEGSSYEGRLPDGSASVGANVAIIKAVFAYGSVHSIVEAARCAAELEPEQTSPRAALVRLAMGHGFYLSGNASRARRPLEEARALTKYGQPLVRISVLFTLTNVSLDEGHLEEAESLALELRALVDRFQLHGIPQSSLAPIALGRVLAERGKLDEAQKELARGLSVRREFPSLSPWATLIGLLALASVRYRCGERAEARPVLAEARSILEAFPEAGIFPELLERQERKLRRIKRRDGSLDGHITEREFDVLGLLVGDLSTRQMAHSLFVAPSTIRTQVKSIYRKLGVSSRDQAVAEARARGLI